MVLGIGYIMPFLILNIINYCSFLDNLTCMWVNVIFDLFYSRETELVGLQFIKMCILLLVFEILVIRM